MEELSVANNMEAEVLQGVYRTPENRMGAISRAASKPANPELETGKVKKGISQVVKELEDENKEVSKTKKKLPILC
jgi:ribosomal protein L7Ae-like RNA K-turn-binding protein